MIVPVRPPAVAGTFYPASPGALGTLVDDLLAKAGPRAGAMSPKAIVAPHAGYVYSGPIAASAFARVGQGITRVVLIGPAHRAYVEGLAWPEAARMRTPLGEIEVDVDALARARVPANAAAHAREHSLEVELPFLQRVAPGAKVIPLAVGRATPEEVGRVLEALWGGAETLIVVSSDLSHYLPYAVGRAQDEETCARITRLDEEPLSGDEACGAAAINGLVRVARAKGMRAELVDLRSSGDTAGPRDEVVGYAAFCLWEGPS
jgi:AmmeMemoRadiSam system protein B